MKRGRSGSNAVEFALILPILALLTTGIMDYGWYLSQRVTVVNACREGARAGALTPQDGDPIARAEAGVAAGLEQAGFDGVIYVDANLEGEAPDQLITVSVGVPYRPLTGFVPVPELLVATLVMRMEDQPG